MFIAYFPAMLSGCIRCCDELTGQISSEWELGIQLVAGRPVVRKNLLDMRP